MSVPDELHVGRACGFCVESVLGLRISCKEASRDLEIEGSTGMSMVSLVVDEAQWRGVIVCGRNVIVRCDDDNDVKKGESVGRVATRIGEARISCNDREGTCSLETSTARHRIVMGQ